MDHISRYQGGKLMKSITFGLTVLTMMLFVSSCNNSKSSKSGRKVDISIRGGGSSKPSTSALRGSDTTASSLQQAVGVSASSLKLKVYKVGFSKKGDCSDPVVIDLDGSYIDFLSSEASDSQLGEGELRTGNYKCIIMEMSDYVKFTPAVSQGSHCVGGTEYTLDVCQMDASIVSILPPYSLLDGSDTTACSASIVEDKVVMHLSVDAPDEDNLAVGETKGTFLYPPLSTDPQVFDGNDGNRAEIYGGFYLASSFNVTEGGSGVFYMDTTGKIVSQTSDSTCVIKEPKFGFYSE